MDLSEISKLIENFSNYLPKGPVKTITLKTALNIGDYVTSFRSSGKLVEDCNQFDKYFYDIIASSWIEDISYYTLDYGKESFIELFQDFRFAVHRVISNKIKTNDISI